MGLKAKLEDLQVGYRVTVCLPEGHPLRHLSGTRGEIVQIGAGEHIVPTDANVVRFTAGHSATCPLGCEEKVLVDDQYHDGHPKGPSAMREWFSADEIEIG